MSNPVASIEDIKRRAREAAERGEPMNICHYPAGSEAEKVWKAAYWQRELELDTEQPA